MNTLDKEFRAALQAKINEAAKLLQEVNSSLEEKGESFLDLTQDHNYEDDTRDEGETTLDLYPIIKVLDAGGWSTSGMSC